jgi:hypothetical protein
MRASDNRRGKMLRAIFQGFANGMRWLFGYAFSFVLWPFSLLGGGGRRAPGGVSTETLKAVEQQVTATAPKAADLAGSRLRDNQRDAQIAWSWITTCLLTRQQLPFPSSLSKTMQNWLQGLDYAQMVALRDAGATGISSHFTGKNALPDVPAVRSLAPVAIKFPAEIQNPDTEIAGLRFSV